MSTFWRLFNANLKNLLRDRMATFWFLAFPVLFILLFGAIFSGNDEARYKVGLAITPGDPLGEGVAHGFESVSAFEVSKGTVEEELVALKKGDRGVVVEIPGDAAMTLATGRKIVIPVYYDKGKEMTGQVLHSIVSEILHEVEARATGRPRLFETKLTAYQTDQLKNIDYLLPGVLAMALMQLGIFGALELVSLRERKVLKSLGATPLPRPMILGSEILVRLLVSLAQTAVLVAIGVLVFRVHMVGNPFAILGLVLLGSLTFVSLGYMLASFSRTIEAGQAVAQVVQFPMMFLSGIFFPIHVMPKFLLPVVKVMPLTYLGDALRQVMVGTAPEHALVIDLAVLGGWLVVSMILAIAFWRWE